MSSCSVDGCWRNAKVAFKLNVPAQHCIIGSHHPASVIISVPVCGTHFRQAEVSDFLDERMRDLISLMTSNLQRKPDFDRAWLEKLPLDSEEYQKYERHLESIQNPAIPENALH